MKQMLVSIGLIVILTACAIDLNVWQRLAYRYPNNVDAVIENSNVLRIGYDLTATTPYPPVSGKLSLQLETPGARF